MTSKYPSRMTALATHSLLLASLFLGGCATEQALTEQTQPLEQRLARLEQELKDARLASAQSQRHQSESLSTRQAASERRLADLDEAVKGLAGQARDQDARAAALAQEMQRGDQALARKVEQSAKAMEQASRALASRLDTVAARADESARRLDTLASRQEADAAARAATDKALADRLGEMEQRLKDLTTQVHEAMALAAKEIFLAYGKEAFSVTLTEDRVLYPQNDPTLESRDVAKLDDLAARLGRLDQEYHLDIQGHTDNTSTEDNNYNLGKARAEVVKLYLRERRGISINRMSTISYGASKPAEGKGDRNRRVHIRVLVLK